MRAVVIAMIASVGGSACDQVYNLTRPPDANTSDGGVDAGDPGACSSISMLNDTFDIDTLATRWPGSYADLGAISVQNGMLVLQNNRADAFVTLDSDFYYDVRDRAFTVKFGDGDPFPVAGAYVHVTLSDEVQGRSVSIQRTEGLLRFVVEDGGQNIVTSIDYVPSEHVYQRIAFDGRMVSFQTSPNGTAYMTHGTRNLDMTFARATIQTYRASTTAAYAVLIDELGDGGPRSAACRTTDLREGFEVSELGPHWARTTVFRGLYEITQESFHVINNGVTPPDASLVALKASRLYDLRDSAVSVEISEMVMPDVAKTVSLIVGVPGGDSIQIQQTDGMLRALASADEMELNPYIAAYNHAAMRWWRIRNAGGQTHWEISADGATWDSLSSTTSLSGLDRVSITVQSYATAGDEDAARFDNINLPLP